MKFRITPILALVCTIFLCGCHSPIVPINSMAYSIAFRDNGEVYHFSKEYKCALEDVSLMSARGEKWDVRGSSDVVKIIGNLHDGSKFEALPIPQFRLNLCFENAGAVDSGIFVQDKLNAAHVEEFTKIRTISDHHKIKILESNLTVNNKSFGLGSGQQNNDAVAAISEPTWKWYYTLGATQYDHRAWEGGALGKFIQSKQVRWLKNKQSHLYPGWSDNDVTLHRMVGPLLDTSKYAVDLEMTAFANETWIDKGAENRALDWFIQPQVAENKARENNPQPEFKRWVMYHDAKIEMPISCSNYRIFYEPEHDNLIAFKIKCATLW